MPTLTAELARLALTTPVPPTLLGRACDGVTDFLAAAFAGSETPEAARARGLFLPLAGPGAAPLIGRAERADVLTSALLNAQAGHALDYDDMHPVMRGHPSTVILPALFAVAAQHDRNGADLLAAYVIGVEVAARVGRAIGSRHYEAGFHATSTVGPIAAAAAVARFLRLDGATTATALGIAATQGCGLRAEFGSETKPLHAGFAARAGVQAVLIAQAGLSGAADVLQAPSGFFAAFGLGQADPSAVLTEWGTDWQIVTPGLTFKEFACCTGTHCAAQATLGLRAQHDIAADDIRAITVTFPPAGDAALNVRHPVTGVDGRFSVEYVIASILIEGYPGLTTFGDRPVPAAIDRLGRRVTRAFDPSAPRLSNDPATRFAVVDIEMTDGCQLQARANAVQGAGDLRHKFLDAAGAARAAVLADIAALPQAASLVPFLSALAMPRALT
ncbi:MAG TPA: MmgE/PrpD family protein [Paenirhodobacter sp.]